MDKTIFSFEAIGTHWQIDIYQDLKKSEQKALKKVILTKIEEFDKTFSRFRTDSLVTQISQSPGEYILPAEAKKMLDLSLELYQKTQGKFTPLVGRLLDQAGYDANYSLLPQKKIEKVWKWEEALEYNFPHLKVLKKGVLLDFGALGKGDLIDLLEKILKDHSVTSFCIDAGGDILYKTSLKKPLIIGLEHPHNLNQVIGTVKILNKSICASSGNRRKWANFHHIMDPETLSSTDQVLAVWVIAKTAILADALATCLFFVEPAVLKGLEFEHLILYPDLTVSKSANFKAELYYN